MKIEIEREGFSIAQEGTQITITLPTRLLDAQSVAVIDNFDFAELGVLLDMATIIYNKKVKKKKEEVYG